MKLLKVKSSGKIHLFDVNKEWNVIRCNHTWFLFEHDNISEVIEGNLKDITCNSCLRIATGEQI